MPRRLGRLVAVLAGVAVVGATVMAVATRHQTAPAPGRPTGLTVDGLTSPIGIDDTPTFAWHVSDDRGGALQAAYRLVVAKTHLLDRTNVWDSGKVLSARQAFVAYGGPPLVPDTRYLWTVQTWATADGNPSRTAIDFFDTGLRDADWKANWIRRATSDPTDAADDYSYARREFTVTDKLAVRAVAYVSADQQYQLWFNGAKAGAGEAYSYPDSQYYQAVDLTAGLRQNATNAIGVLYHWAGVGKGRPAGAPGVIVQLSIWYADGSTDTVVTDSDWKVARAPWLPSTPRNLEGDPVDSTENVDGRAVPIGWSAPRFDDGTWSAATVIGPAGTAPWTHLVSERTRVVETPARAVSVTRLGNGAYVADFGAVIAAVPTVTFRDAVAGRRITMHAGYLLDGDGQVSTQRGTQHTDLSYSYVEADGEQTFTPFDYLGFRYFQIDDPGETLTPAQVVAYARHSDMPSPQATFESSNSVVDAVFALARHSAEFGSQEQFIDTPTREKAPFLRDSFNISQTIMRAFGEQDLTRRTLIEFAQSQARYWPDGRINAVYPSGEGKRDIPDFTEIYPDWVWQYYMATGDVSLVRTVYPAVAGVAAYVTRAIDPATSLVTNLPGGDGDYLYGLVDWPPAMRYGYDMRTAARTTENALAVDALRRAASLAEAVGRPGSEIDALRATADKLVAAVNERLVRSDGLYVDGLRADGTQSPDASQHANAYALAYGIVPASHVAAVAAAVGADGMKMGPQTVQALLAALDAGGRDDDIVALLTNANQDGWAKILASGGTFTWESWEPSDAEGDSLSHGWGATVLVNIQESLLGVRPLTPAWATFQFAPPLSGLTRASGTVPALRGVVKVSWSHANGRWTLDVTVPSNSTASVGVPAASAARVGGLVRGSRVDRTEGGRVWLTVGAGTYHFTSS